jgi:hypothetical protein
MLAIIAVKDFAACSSILSGLLAILGSGNLHPQSVF